MMLIGSRQRLILTNPDKPMPDLSDDSPETDARQMLIERLDTVIQQVEQNDHAGARGAIFVRRWINEADTEGIPKETVDQVGAFTDDAHSALSRWPPDMVGAMKWLQEARKLLASE